MQHTTVFPVTAVDALSLSAHSIVVDATLGNGGHTREIAKRLTPPGCVVGFDVDPKAIRDAKQWKAKLGVELTLIHANFVELASFVAVESVDAILADLGWRMEQFTDEQRGFSFANDGPLLMTYGESSTYAFTATDIVNSWSEESIANIIKGYGEERFAQRIAATIVKSRKEVAITSSCQLAAVISSAIPKRFHSPRIHPATKSFQALRIAVNDELQAVEKFIDVAWSRLVSGGRLAIISFHSLEDRIVKHRFRELKQAGVAILPYSRPIVPDEIERHDNPRSRSAKLRTIKKL